MENKPTNAYTKKKLNNNYQFIIMQTTKKPFSISLTKTLIGIISFSFLCYICFSIYIFTENRLLKNTISNRQNEVVNLKQQLSSLDIENDNLKYTINQKNKIINEKISLIETQIEEIDSFEESIRIMLNPNSSFADKISSEQSDDITSRGMFLRNIIMTDSTDSVSSSNQTSFGPNSVNLKLIEYNYLLSQNKDTIVELYKDVEDRADYLDSVPDYFPAPGRITSYFGYRKNPFTNYKEFHHGVDISNYSGTNIKAAGKGTIVETGYNYMFGRYIIINHGYGFSTKYAHLLKVDVEKGDKVQKGDVIASMGSTGQSTGPHLHYEIKVNNERINPLSIKDYIN